MTSIAGGLNTGIWLCAVVLGATGSAIIVTVAASLLCAGVKCIVKHFKNGGYNRLTDVQQAAQIWGVSQDDFLDCINYLAMAKYIQLRTIADKILVPDFADIGWDLLEAKLTAEGISVLCHKTKDEMIEV